MRLQGTLRERSSRTCAAHAAFGGVEGFGDGAQGGEECVVGHAGEVGERFGGFVGEDGVAEGDAAVADVDARPGDELFDVGGWFEAEGAVEGGLGGSGGGGHVRDSGLRWASG